MKPMLIEYRPQKDTKEKARKVFELRIAKTPWKEIVEQFGHSKRYLMALNEWYKKEELS